MTADPVSLLREVRKSLASMPGCDCESCSLVTRIDEALRLADDAPGEVNASPPVHRDRPAEAGELAPVSPALASLSEEPGQSVADVGPDSVGAADVPRGPPFTVERYGTFGQSVIAERDWLLEEVEQLRKVVEAACIVAGSTVDARAIWALKQRCDELAAWRRSLDVPAHPSDFAECYEHATAFPIGETCPQCSLTRTTEP